MFLIKIYIYILYNKANSPNASNFFGKYFKNIKQNFETLRQASEPNFPFIGNTSHNGAS